MTGEGAGGLRRVRPRPTRREDFGPVRLGPQDLRDVAATFAELDAAIGVRDYDVPTEFTVTDRGAKFETRDIGDVLAHGDADTLSHLSVYSTRMRLGLEVGRRAASISRPMPPPAGERAAQDPKIDVAEERLREILRSRELTGPAATRQRGPRPLTIFALTTLGLAQLLGSQPLLALWLQPEVATGLASGLLWLTIAPLIWFAWMRPRDPVRLRGRERSWPERHQGAIAVAALAVAVVVPFLVVALERALP